MYKKRRYKRKQKGKGTLLGSDWPKIRKNLVTLFKKKETNRKRYLARI